MKNKTILMAEKLFLGWTACFQIGLWKQAGHLFSGMDVCVMWIHECCHAVACQRFQVPEWCFSCIHMSDFQSLSCTRKKCVMYLHDISNYLCNKLSSEDFLFHEVLYFAGILLAVSSVPRFFTQLLWSSYCLNKINR